MISNLYYTVDDYYYAFCIAGTLDAISSGLYLYFRYKRYTDHYYADWDYDWLIEARVKKVIEFQYDF